MNAVHLRPDRQQRPRLPAAAQAVTSAWHPPGLPAGSSSSRSKMRATFREPSGLPLGSPGARALALTVHPRARASRPTASGSQRPGLDAARSGSVTGPGSGPGMLNHAPSDLGGTLRLSAKWS